MKTALLATLITGSLFIVPAVDSAEADASPTNWQALWDIGDKNTSSVDGHAYNRQWLDVQNKIWPGIAKKCMPQLKKENIREFRAVLLIDESGRLTEFMPSQESDGIRCFEKEMLGKQYPKPPKPHFYMAFGIKSR